MILFPERFWAGVNRTLQEHLQYCFALHRRMPWDWRPIGLICSEGIGGIIQISHIIFNCNRAADSGRTLRFSPKGVDSVTVCCAVQAQLPAILRFQGGGLSSVAGCHVRLCDLALLALLSSSRVTANLNPTGYA